MVTAEKRRSASLCGFAARCAENGRRMDSLRRPRESQHAVARGRQTDGSAKWKTTRTALRNALPVKATQRLLALCDAPTVTWPCGSSWIIFEYVAPKFWSDEPLRIHEASSGNRAGTKLGSGGLAERPRVHHRRALVFRVQGARLRSFMRMCRIQCVLQ